MEGTISLYNSSNVIVDQVTVPAVNDNVPFVRDEQGQWSTGSHATPGYENTDAGFNSWLESRNTQDISLVISEVASGGGFSMANGTGSHSDWIELHNTGSKTVVLDGSFLSDDPEDRTKWMIPALSIEPGERVVVRCAGATAGENEANFALSRDGCTVILTGVYGNTISQVNVPALGKECSWALQADGTYLQTAQSTPGYDNTDEGYALWMQAVGGVTPEIRISEVMTANRSTIRGKDGSFCDWVAFFRTMHGRVTAPSC